MDGVLIWVFVGSCVVVVVECLIGCGGEYVGVDGYGVEFRDERRVRVSVRECWV